MNLSGVYSLAVSSALVVSPITQIESQQISEVVNIQSLSEIQVYQPDQTLFLLDLDDTVFDFPDMLGSRMWRTYIRQATKEIDNGKDWHDVISYFLTKNYPVQTVEPMTSEFIKNLQEKGHVVCGFTSRERKAWYDMPQEGVDSMTTDQLNSVDVDFNNSFLEKTYPDLALEPEYYSGTFFCNIEPKGQFLKHLFETIPENLQKVIFIDDKFSQAQSVSDALTYLGINHESYCYLATNAKAKTFNPLIANIQLYHFLKFKEVLFDDEILLDGEAISDNGILSDDEALLIANKNPSYDANFYLNLILEALKTFNCS